jgi:dipeptidyl aminopeptidase/acylaminoacyl peptidase
MNQDWRRFFDIPRVAWAGAARLRPERGLVCTDVSGQRQLHSWNVETNELRQLTNVAHGVATGTLSPDGRHVYWANDVDGKEKGHLVRVRWEGGDVEQVDQEAKPFAVPAFILPDVTGTRIAFIVAEPDGSRVELLPLSPEGDLGEQRTVWRSRALIRRVLCSADGAFVAVRHNESTQGLHESTSVIDTTTGRRVADFGDGADATVSPMLWAPGAGDLRLLAVTSTSGRELPILLSPLSGERHALAVNDIEGTVLPLDWASDPETILLLQVHRAITRLHLYYLTTRQHRPVPLVGALNPSVSRPAWFAPDGIRAVLEDSTHPGRVVAIDPQSDERERSILTVDTGGASASEWRSIEFESRGDVVQAWLATPGDAGPWPVVIETHGGPEAVELETYWPGAQAWLANGFAYCTVNYHGSTTFGSAFRDSIVGCPGDLEVDDVVAARQWLVDHRVAIPEQVLLTGISYGGYLTLQTVGRRPELWAGGIAIVAIADWRGVVGDETTPALRLYAERLLGGSPDTNPDVYRSASPITYAERVQAPLLVIQGRGDTRVPAAQLERYAARVRQTGGNIEVVWFEAGHQLGTRDQRVTWMKAALGLAARALDRKSA